MYSQPSPSTAQQSRGQLSDDASERLTHLFGSRAEQRSVPATDEDVAGWRDCRCALIVGVHLAYEHELAMVEPMSGTEARS